MVVGDDAPFPAMRAVSDGHAAVQGDQGWGYAIPYSVGIEFGGHYTAAGDFSMVWPQCRSRTANEAISTARLNW